MMAQELSTQSGREIARGNGATDRAAMVFDPMVDIFERGDTTVIVADMPGVTPDDVDVTLERQILTLSGQIRAHVPDGYRRLSSEYQEGDYKRVFTLSAEVDQSKIKANFRNGVLRLELPRAAEAKPKKISVKAG